MELNFIKGLIAKEISVDEYFHTLTKLGWKYDLEESDLFIALSKTFWQEGIKVSVILKEFCCVPPNNEKSFIEDIGFYTFDVLKYPMRDIYTVYNSEEKNDDYSEWKSVDEYISYFNKQYPYYIPFADFNTGLRNNDYDMLKIIDLTEVPVAILNNIVSDLKHLSKSDGSVA